MEIRLFFLTIFFGAILLCNASEALTIQISNELCPIAVPQKTTQLRCNTYYQTTKYTCGASAVMMIMHYYGKLNSKNMNHATEIEIANEMGGADHGTSPSQVSSWLSEHNFSVDSGQRINTDTLIDKINLGELVIIGMNNHWMVAKGYSKGSTPAEDEIIFADSSSGVTVISRNQIDSMWLDSRMPLNHCESNTGTYIIAVPR